MGFGVLGVFLGLLLEVSTHGPHAVPRSTWKHQDIDIREFSEPGIFNYTTLLLSEERGALYVGAREAIFELSQNNITQRKNKAEWTVEEQPMEKCFNKGKSKERDCLNYIRVLQVVDKDRLYVCGTYAFTPQCDYLSLADFTLTGQPEDGRGRCSFDPYQSFTSVMVDGELYTGTAYNFLGSEPIISRFSPPKPSFVFADVIREGRSKADGEDDKVYYFFTEVSVEYEFFGKLLIPRVARVCKGDLGGQRTLQKKWTSFLKAKLVCSMPELNFVFNVVHDIFILKATDWRDTVIYGVFTSQWDNVGLSAVCAYNLTAVEDVFSKGKYMQKATVEQSHTKWVRYNGVTPSPRPGACINNDMRQDGISSSLDLPDKTLQFVKDHPLLENPVQPIGNRPQLITKDVNYTQIVVDRVRALDGNIYDVIFTGTDKGILHKSVVFEGDVHIIEEIQLLKNSQPIKNLLLSTGTQSIYAGSDSGVVQSPTFLCGKYLSCTDCIMARDPYCAWDPHTNRCVNRNSLNNYQSVRVKPGSSAELPCVAPSNLAHVLWKSNGSLLTDASRFHLIGESGLLIYSVASEDQGHYECWSVEWAPAAEKNFSRQLAGYILTLDIPASQPHQAGHVTTTLSSKEATSTQTLAGNGKERVPLTSALVPSSFTTFLTSPPQTDSSLTPPHSRKFQPIQTFSPSSYPSRSGNQEATATSYLQQDNSTALLLLFFCFSSCFWQQWCTTATCSTFLPLVCACGLPLLVITKAPVSLNIGHVRQG
uniref:Semaphorin 4D n=1 Tax=Neogobius melanostomus TaxID=47308 RepID=A0A8C6WKN2_9GOBI